MQWLCISSDYQRIHVALCNKNKVLLQSSVDKKRGNQQLLLAIDELLKTSNVQLCDMQFIGINLGPAPYTSLRIAIVTANGLNTATGIPLVGIDALQAFMHAYPAKDERSMTIALLNAFNRDVFYAISKADTPLKAGYENIDTFLANIAQQDPDKSILFIGNGIDLYQDNIKENIKTYTIADPLPMYPDMQQLVNLGWHNWQEEKTIKTAMPLYLKVATYKSSIKVK